jgi:hypothetical protein
MNTKTPVVQGGVSTASRSRSLGVNIDESETWFFGKRSNDDTHRINGHASARVATFSLTDPDDP